MEAYDGQRAGSFVLLGDQPYDGKHDPLGFEDIAEDLASLILSSRRSTPFTLGIEAAWGMGKSTLMGHLCKRLSDEPGVRPVLFNAWTADGGGVLEGLVKTVLNELDANVLRRALRNQKLMGWLRVTLNVAASVLGLANLVDTIWKQSAADPRLRNDLRQLVEEAVTAWRQKRPEPGRDRLLCVFVDDLDRCSPQGVLEVFEAMKLYLDVPGIVFVVGYDQGIVSDLVLREKGYAETIRSRDYLEKFIQIVYRIPRSVPDQSNDFVDSLLTSSGTAALFGENERELVIDGSQANPRRIKRFINAFVLAYGLDPRWREFAPQALVRLQLLQMYFPEFARILERRSERDPIEEFVEFRAARDALRRREPRSESVAAALQSHGLAPVAPEEADSDAVLTRLEENVPVEFVALAGRKDFNPLVERIAAEDDWPRLRAALAEGELPLISTDSIQSDRDAGGVDGSRPFDGLRVLWVDDEMELNEEIIEVLTAGGAKVTTVDTTVAMRHALESRRFDVLVSDIARSGNPEEGLEALESLRLRLGDDPPSVRTDLPRIIFFSARVTAARRARARLLDAPLTTDAAELLELLEATALERGSDGRAPSQ